MECGAALFGKATFAMDRGYDDNKMFLKLDELEQDYVIRLTAKRKLFFHGKWIPATQLRNQRKGKIKTVLTYKGKKHDAYLSHVKVQITASKKDIYKMKVLLMEYNAKKEKTFADILDFHIVPFIMEDNLKMFYYRGLKEWDNEKGYLTDTCLTAQDKYKAYLDYFRIMY